mmetsp:Transcript_109808/g.310352  ORF Transcript_109808/g.310352 Transcript_109808/m.310352 type:complete len:232 (-) Transcript_109808:3582-4277(-)
MPVELLGPQAREALQHDLRDDGRQAHDLALQLRGRGLAVAVPGGGRVRRLLRLPALAQLLELPLLAGIVAQHRATQPHEPLDGLRRVLGASHSVISLDPKEDLERAAQGLALLLQQPRQLLHLAHEAQALERLPQLYLLVERLREVEGPLQRVQEGHDARGRDVLVVLLDGVLQHVDEQQLDHTLDDYGLFSEGQLCVSWCIDLDAHELPRHAVAEQLEYAGSDLLPGLRL